MTKAEIKSDLADQLVKVKREIDALEHESRIIRDQLTKLLKDYEKVEVSGRGYAFTVSKDVREKRILVDNATLAASLGKQKFLEIAKVSPVDLEKSVNPKEFKKFVSRVETSEVIVVRQNTK